MDHVGGKPKYYLLLFCDSLVGAETAMDGEIATAHLSPHRGARLHILNCC